MSGSSWSASAYSNGFHLPTNLISFSLLRKLPGGPQGWSREIQAGFGGTDGVRRGAWDESFRPTRASAASCCNCRSEGPDVQARQEVPGACAGAGRSRLGTLTSTHPQVLPSAPAFPFCRSSLPQGPWRPFLCQNLWL